MKKQYWAVRFVDNDRFRVTSTRFDKARDAMIDTFGMASGRMVAVPFNIAWRSLTLGKRVAIEFQLSKLANERTASMSALAKAVATAPVCRRGEHVPKLPKDERSDSLMDHEFFNVCGRCNSAIARDAESQPWEVKEPAHEAPAPAPAPWRIFTCWKCAAFVNEGEGKRLGSNGAVRNWEDGLRGDAVLCNHCADQLVHPPRNTNPMQIVPNCSVEWDRRRGVLYVHNKETGDTILRICRLASKESGDLANGQINITGPFSHASFPEDAA